MLYCRYLFIALAAAAFASCNTVKSVKLGEHIINERTVIDSLNRVLRERSGLHSSASVMSMMKRHSLRSSAFDYIYHFPIDFPFQVSDSLPFKVLSIRLIDITTSTDENNGFLALSQKLVFEVELKSKVDTMLNNRLYCFCYFADKTGRPICYVSEPVLDDRNMYATERVYEASKRYCFHTAITNSPNIEALDHVVFFNGYK